MKTVQPGCYGSFVLFSRSETVCAGCAFNESCAFQAYENGVLAMKELNKLHTALKAEPAIPVYRSAEEELFDGLPTKARPIAIKLSRFVTDIKSSMTNGRAVECSPSFMATAFNALRGGFTKRRLKELFMVKHGWSEGTAASHVSIALSVMKVLKLGAMNDKEEFRIDI